MKVNFKVSVFRMQEKFRSKITGEPLVKLRLPIEWFLNELKDSSNVILVLLEVNASINNEIYSINQSNDITLSNHNTFILGILIWITNNRTTEDGIAYNCTHHNILLKDDYDINDWVKTISDKMIIHSIVRLDAYRLLMCLKISIISGDKIQFNDLMSDTSIDVNMQTLYDTLKLKSNGDNGDMIDDQLNFLLDDASNDKGILNVLLMIKFISCTYNCDSNFTIYLLGIDYNSIIFTNLICILNMILRIVLDIFENMVSMCVHELLIMVNHIANDMDTIIVVLRALSVHLFDYNHNVLGYSNYCMTKRAAHETGINSGENLYSFSVKSVKIGNHDLIAIIWMYAYANQTVRFNIEDIDRVMVQTRYGFAYNNVTRLTDNINDIYFTFRPSIPDGIIDLFLLLYVDFINTDSIGTCLNCDYLRSRYEVLFIEIIDVYEEVYARIIFYKMKHFILVNVIISNIDGKCVNTTNNESLLMCIGANNYRFIIIEDIPNILFDCINNDNCVYGKSTYEFCSQKPLQFVLFYPLAL